jgi:glycerol-3-phosphate dehydrogenase
MAWSLGDALLRRLDIGTLGPPAEAEVVRAAQVMAADLGWDAPRLAAERGAAGPPRSR